MQSPSGAASVSDKFPDFMFVTMEVDPQGNLLSVDAPTGVWPNDEPPTVSGLRIATAITDFSYSGEAKVQTSPIQGDKFNALGANRHSFLYVDCGRWGGPTKNFPAVQRDFAVVWYRHAALCEFVPNGSLRKEDNVMKDGEGKRRIFPLNDFIESLFSSSSSVRLIKGDTAITPPDIVEPTKDVIYVILPDLHLPVFDLPRPDIKVGDGHNMGRHRYTERTGTEGEPDQNGMVSTLGGPKQLCLRARQWFNFYVEGDILGGKTSPAARDMSQFLDLVARSPFKDKVHFIQVGDMYDFWIGLIPFFDDVKPPEVVLGDRRGIRAGDFIDNWTKRTHDLFGSMLDSMHTMPTQKKSFLWGNHDNYLSKHTPVGKPVPTRIRQVRENGHFIEHGQRGDPSNRDGKLSGHTTTNLVFEASFLRSVDPNRRNYFVTAPAISYAIKPDFAVYVMGHTHERFLTTIFPLVRIKKK